MRIAELKDDSGHVPADHTAHATWCLKCGRAIVAVYGKGWALRFPNSECKEPGATPETNTEIR